MSYAGRHYGQYNTYCLAIHPDVDDWDRHIHYHTSEELLLIVSEGECTVDSNGNTYQIPTPAFIWNRAGSYHLVRNVNNDICPSSYLAVFQPSVLADIPPKLRYTDFMQGHGMFALPLSKDRLDRMEAFFKLQTGGPIHQRQLLLPCIFHQVSLYLKAGAKPICSSIHYGYIFQVLSLLENSPCEKITVKELTERFHVSRSKLSADFKQVTGQSIHTYHKQIQLQSARVLLTATNKTLVDVATACGFTDESHLIRSFRKKYGTTPGAFRKQYKNDPRWIK